MDYALENIFILLLALLIDLSIGEYPRYLHPVEWIGGAISILLRPAPRRNTARFIYGTLAVCLCIALFSVLAYFLLVSLRGLSLLAYVIVSAILLKATFSLKGLCQAAQKVKRLLERGELTMAKQEAGYLVSRDTQTLDSQRLTSAVIEMSAESVTDSFIAPLFYWLLLGVPGALAYRVVNTFDSRIGYHGEYEYLGKFAARTDDVLNYIPARISGLLLVAAAYLSRKNGKRAWHIMLRDHCRVESPNAGWTMAAMAGALDVQLEKPGYYLLGDAKEPLSPHLINSSLMLVLIACLIWCGICLSLIGVCYGVTT